MISLIQGRQSPPHLQDEALIPLREPALSARHLQRSVSRQVPGPHPPGDLHHPQGRGDRQDASTLPSGQEERDGRPRVLHVQPVHQVRVGGVGRAVLSQVRSKLAKSLLCDTMIIADCPLMTSPRMRVFRMSRRLWRGLSRSPRLTRSTISASHSRPRPTQPRRQRAWKVFKRNSDIEFLYSN